MKNNEWAGVGNHFDFKFRGYDPRIGRFSSVDPLASKYPWNSVYAFAENDVIRAKDLEGAEKLIMTDVNQKARTAKLTIVKDIQILQLKSMPQPFLNQTDLDKKTSALFKKGNTTVYVKKLPENGQPVEYESAKDFKNGKGFQLIVEYQVNVTIVDDRKMDKSIDGDNGRISTVGTCNVADNSIGAVSTTEPFTRQSINVNVNFDFNGSLTPAEILTHEAGFHNMESRKHTIDFNGVGNYPPLGLESNQHGQIYPTSDDTKNIIYINVNQNRLETK